MRAVVVGGDGFLGANLCAFLLERGHEVTATALNRKGHSSLEALSVECPVEYGDVLDPVFLGRVINASEADWVFHLAAVSIVRIAQASPARALQTNIMGTVNVLEACRRANHVRAVVVASSDKAYGDHGGAPYVETMPLLPTGPYELSKAAADQIATMYGRLYGLPVTVARCANLYGPADLNFSRLVPNSCRQAVRGLAPVVHEGAWGMRREWLHVRWAAAAYVLLAEAGVPGEAYNVGSGDLQTAGEMAWEVARLAGAPTPTEQPKAASFYEIPSQALDYTKVQALGWSVPRWVSKSLVDTIEWYREYLLGERVAVPA